MKAGVTLNPHTPICLLEDIIQDVDMVLLMSVNPGFGGQRFIEHSVDKVARLREMIDRKGGVAIRFPLDMGSYSLCFDCMFGG